MTSEFGISQQWEFDFMALGEVLQDSPTIVADRRELQSLRFKPLLCVLQLHELRFAKRSPIGGAEEKENRTLRTFQCLVGLLMAKLIGQSKCRRVLPDFQAKRARNDLIGGRVFLPTSKAKQSKKEKYDHRNSHLKFVFFLVPSTTPKPRQSDESSQKPKGYTPVSNSRKFPYLGFSQGITAPSRPLRSDQQKSFRQFWKLRHENPISSFVHVLRMIVETDVKASLAQSKLERGTDQQREPKR